MEELNKAHELQPIAFEDIPTPEEHARDVRRIFVSCGAVASILAVLALLAVGAAIGRGVQLQTLAFIVPIVMGVGIATFAIGYAIPVGLVSLKRLEIAFKMGYYGLSQNRDTVSSLKKIAERVDRELKPLPSSRRPGVED
jgi:hypothetical protein